MRFKTWKIMYINDDYVRILKEGCEKDMRKYYNVVYKEHRHVYILMSPQEYTERFEWDF
jgi:hypothetical protein